MSGTTQLTGLEVGFHLLSIPLGGLHNTKTGCVRDNDPGAQDERNGALTIQAVAVDSTGADDFTVDATYSNGGVQGVATSGLLWEATIFWHWSGDCYGSSGGPRSDRGGAGGPSAPAGVPTLQPTQHGDARPPFRQKVTVAERREAATLHNASMLVTGSF